MASGRPNRTLPSRRSSVASNFMDGGAHENDSGRELFEACRTGDVTRVRYLLQNNWNVNMRDTAGRKSTPLHFAAGSSSRLFQLYLQPKYCDLIHILS